jgi:large subunit ribosomal protein L2
MNFLCRHICFRKTPNRAIAQEASSIIWSGPTLKPFRKGKFSTGGRNGTGKKMFMSRGGGHKRLYRSVNFSQPRFLESGFMQLKVSRVEYDPNRSAWISLLHTFSNSDGFSKQFYTVHTDGVFPGDTLYWGAGSPVNNGNRLPLHSIPSNTWIHNLETNPMRGAVISRSAGTRCKLLRSSSSEDSALVSLPSGYKAEFSPNCFATVGAVSNPKHNQIVLRKAGVSRWLGRRPFSRGIAKNPVDHPHGGRTNGGCHPKTPWGKLTKGVKTRSVKKPKLTKRG